MYRKYKPKEKKEADLEDWELVKKISEDLDDWVFKAKNVEKLKDQQSKVISLKEDKQKLEGKLEEAQKKHK